MPSRREFIATGAAAGVTLLASPSTALADTAVRSILPPGRHPLRILILGGTGFLGPHTIAYALGRGHQVTTFTRGRTDPTVHQGLFNNVEQLVGDRATDLSALRGRHWDAVIDNSGQQAAWTRASAELLRDTVDLYLYTSSTGVYYPYLGSDLTESTELVMEVPPGLEGDAAASYGYGVMKANSELEARRIFGDDRTIVVRPTYIMGPGDRTDRFTYWPVRLARGGEVLVPGHADDPVQYIDVRDVSEWMVRLIEGRVAGTFNAVGPASNTGMHQFVYGAHAAFSSRATFIAVDDYDFLMEHELPFSIPWIIPLNEYVGSALVNKESALANGLTYRPLAQSAHDIYEWWMSDAVEPERRERMRSGERSLMAREGELLEAWKRRG
ncbi:MAG: NAD-dependent epimerase/dehydratase family protein [Gemmatimonadota bacterium]